MNRKSKYKDIKKWRETCHQQRLRYYGKTAYAENHHKRWTPEEIEMVMLREIPDRTISKLIGRSMEAIQLARCKANKKGRVTNGRTSNVCKNDNVE